MTTATPPRPGTDHRYTEMARCVGFGILTGLTIMLVSGVLPAPAIICTILCYTAILLGVAIDSRTQDSADHAPDPCTVRPLPARSIDHTHDLDYGHRAA